MYPFAPISADVGESFMTRSNVFSDEQRIRKDMLKKGRCEGSFLCCLEHIAQFPERAEEHPVYHRLRVEIAHCGGHTGISMRRQIREYDFIHRALYKNC